LRDGPPGYGPSRERPSSEGPSRRRLLRWCVTVLTLFLLASAGFLAGCGKTTPGTQEQGKEGQGKEGKGGGEEQDGQGGPVTLTLYFMEVTPTDFYLVPEKRTIPYTQAVARAAMEELFKGPAEGSGLKAIFPNTVKVLDISIKDGICTLNVSKEIITDKAQQGGAGAAVEGLALTSIANTLTEFPTIQKVKLLVEGQQSGMVDGLFIEDFWGHVGLPEYLERDMSKVKAPS
jgi:spore germination protein GerM